MRTILAACFLGGLAILGLITVVAIRFGTDWAIPGWATYVAASLIIILVQVILLVGVALFQLLSFRSLKPFIPASDANSFVVDDASTLTSRRDGSSAIRLNEN